MPPAVRRGEQIHLLLRVGEGAPYRFLANPDHTLPVLIPDDIRLSLTLQNIGVKTRTPLKPVHPCARVQVVVAAIGAHRSAMTGENSIRAIVQSCHSLVYNIF